MDDYRLKTSHFLIFLEIDTMAVLLAKAGFWAPCVLKFIGDDLQHIEKRFRIRWKRLDRPSRKLIDPRLAARMELLRIDVGIKTATDDEIAALREKTITEQEFLAEMISDWDLKDAQGHPVPYTITELNDICDGTDGFDVQVFQSYFDTLKTMAARSASEKNSDGLSDTSS